MVQTVFLETENHSPDNVVSMGAEAKDRIEGGNSFGGWLRCSGLGCGRCVGQERGTERAGDSGGNKVAAGNRRNERLRGAFHGLSG